MKRVLLTFVFTLALLFVTPGFAGNVKPEVARVAAETFLSGYGAKTSQMIDVSEAAGFANLYVFTTESSFVVVAGDDRMQPILGYSLTEKFVTEGMPAHVRWWIQSYSDQIQYAKDNNLMANSDAGQAWATLTSGNPYRAASYVVVSPLISTLWDQNYPYNYYCPTDSNGPGGRVYAGCVACAMAQVMKFWNYPTQGTGSHSYTPDNYSQQTANFGATTYDWSNMPTSITSSSSQTEIDAIATLMYHCGVAVDMDYGPDGSGAQSTMVETAFKDYFKFSPTTRYVSSTSYSTDEWIALLKSELDEGRPLYYSGSNENSGHAFVCDGYRSDNYFHFNWGWSGSQNNYWAIGALNPGSGGSGSGAGTYNLYNAIIAGAEPISSLSAPTLSASAANGEITLSWNIVSGASSYDIYKDNVKIVTSYSGTTFTDDEVEFGTTYQYYVRSKSNTATSNPSNTVSIRSTYRNTAPSNLTASNVANGVSLQWTGYTGSNAAKLYYGTESNGWRWGSNGDDNYWGQRYTPAQLEPYGGMAINQVSVYIGETGSYTLYLYKTNTSSTSNRLAQQSFTASSTGWYDVTLSSPIALDVTKDLWVVFYIGSEASYPACISDYTGEGAEYAHYFSNTLSNLPNETANYNNGNMSWLIKTSVTDGTYTYNVYRDGARVASNVNGTSYTDTQVSAGYHTYYVKTNCGGIESEASNEVGLDAVGGTPLTEDVLIYEPFEEYSVGDHIAVASNGAGHSWWTTWSNNPGSSEDGYIVEYEGEKCAHLTYGNDQVLLLGDEENGNYDLEFDILIPEGKNGYFNILHHFAGSNSTWALQAYLQAIHDGNTTTLSPGHGTVHAGSNSTADVPCVYDQWMHFRLNVDTDTDIARYYYTAPGENEILVCEWQWSLDSFGNSVVGRTLAAMNFYPPQSSYSEFYLDNFSFKKIGGDTAPVLSVTPTSVTMELGEDDMTTVDITIENSGTSIGDWYGWVDFGMGSSGSQASDLCYHSGTTGTTIGSASAMTREMAIRLPASAYAGSAMGMRIVSTQFYIADNYQSADHNYIFRIYSQGMHSQPGELLAEKTVNSTDAGTWITATFDNPVYLTGQTLWASVQLEQAAGEYPLPMDGGDYGEDGDGNWLSNNGGSFTHCYSSGSFAGAWMITVNCQGEPIPGTWASMNKLEGSIAAGDSQTVTLSLNTIGLTQLHQEATLMINTNDSLHAHFEIPVVLNLNDSIRNITAIASPTEGGTVSGGGSYVLGETCTLTATANTNYSFQNWTENDVEVSTDSVYSFTVTGNRTLTAVFELSEPTISTFGELGYTTYDWQTNSGAITRTINWPDGKVSFAFTKASTTNYSDRGTGIATYDAANNEWIASQGRVENEKTGFGSIARYGTNGIVVAAHTPSQCGIYIVPDKDNIPNGTVAASGYLDSSYDPTWPNVMTSGANRDIIHVVANAYSSTNVPGAEGANNALLYFRSQDGGQTWDKQNVILPYTGSDYCLDWNSNTAYWMETTEDNCLALVINNAWNDGMVLYSYDDGETWQREVFYQHPGQFNSYESWFFYPRWTSCQWDSNHNLHVLYEFNGTVGDVGSGSYYNGIGGVVYWNEMLPYNQNGTAQSAIEGNLIPGQPFVIDTAYLLNDIYYSWWLWSDASHEMWPEYMGYLPPLTDDGDWEDPYQATEFYIQDRSLHGVYDGGVCTFPVLCRVNNTDDMVAVWCAMDENHTDSNGNYYFKLFASRSNDGGYHWSNMVQLTKDQFFDNKECVYPQAAVVNNTLVVAFQMDGETGTYVQSDDSDASDNRYYGLSFDLDELFGVIPDYVHITATANPTEAGYVVGTGSYALGFQCTLNAVANSGYLFENWTKDNVVVSTEPTYSFTVTEAASFVANFVTDMSVYTVTASCDPVEGGTVTGAGEYTCNNTCTLTAIPNSGYFFLNWTENSVEVSRDSVYTFTVTGNRTLTAVFTDTPPLIPNSNAVITTTYDLQSNTFVANRMYQMPNGSVGVVATMSHNESASDRGTGYNFYNNGQWQDQPETRIEPFKTGWPSIARWGATGEIVVCHGNGGMQCFVREVAGEGEWIYKGALPAYPDGYPYADEYGTWPRVVTCGDNNDVVIVVAALQHVVSSNETDTRSVMWRSEDAENWTVSYGPLADLGLGYENGYFSADDYALAANGHNVALLYSGSTSNSVWMFKSTNDGLTWIPTKVWEDPYEGISWEDDASVYTDTLFRPMNGSIVIDNYGVVHVALNTFEMMHSEVGTSYSYWTGRADDGILYWNDTQVAPIQSEDGNPHHAARLWWYDEENPGYIRMHADSTKWIGYIPVDAGNSWDNENFYHSGTEYFYKFYGASGHPALSCDPYGNLACAYSAPAAKYSNGQYYYRHIYVSYRNADDGYWRQAEDDLTDPNEAPEFDGMESLYTISVPNTVNQGEFWFGFQSDSEIGLYSGSNASQSSATENGIYVKKVVKDVTNTGYHITATAHPTGSGVVTGAGVFQSGQECTLNAVANDTYLFENWTKDGAVVSTEPTYSFTVTEEASFVANFNRITYEIVAEASPVEGGMVSGAGTYEYQSTCTLTATPNANYTFLYWTKDGVTVSTDAEYSFAALENATYTAHFTRTLQPDSNNIVYVKPNGAGSNDGSSWANATGDLSKALEFWATKTTKPTIWVAAGTYYGDGDAANSAFTLVDGVSVYGGFAGNEPADYDLSQRDFTANATILDGQGVQRVLYQPNDFENNTTWSGFTIQNGYVYVDNTSVVPAGAGAYIRNHTTLENSIITANSLQYLKHVLASNGGGVYIIGADAALTNCTITDNHIELIDSDSTSTYVCRGGGVYARNTTVDKCVIANNSSYYYGGGMYVYASNVSNCLIANNSAMYGGAIYGNGTSNNAIRNCDIVRNRAIEYAGGVYSASSAVLDFTNCIIWGNNTESQNYLNILVRPGTTYNYCAIEGGFDGDNNINLFTENDGNGLLYPRFVNPSPTAGNINAFESYSWQLAEGSICINRGDLTNVSNGDLDLAGNPRIQQGGVDMGCYESSYQAAEVPVYADGIVYVKPSASGAMDGTSWDNAMDDINAALSMADLTNTPAIWVAAGTYYGDCIADHIAFTIVEGVDVYGGFAGNEPADYDLTQRDFTSHPTILDGKDERPVVTQNTVFNDTTIWDGLTIQHSISGGRGGGIWTEGGMVLSNLTIKNCSADDGGGGLYLKGSELNKSVIENCSAPVGGGIMCENSTVSNCIFRNNSAEYDGGAAYVWSGTFTDCLFTDNYNAGVYGTICADGRTSEGYEGGTFVNCDIVNNTAYGYSAIYNNDTGGTFKNCIIWGNTSNNGYSQINGSGTFTYCAIEGGYDGTGNINLASSNDGTDNLNYVRFMDATNGNYQLQLGSACIDAGDPDYLPNEALDLGGRARVHDGRVDIGCYEYHGIIETNFSDEICYGEDYVFNGFNIVRPDEGTAVHSITLPSAQGLDSIVNLTLTVNPVYFMEEDTIVCDVSSYTWHGHVYTISGVYYDSLQTVHGCDSVFQLTLELYNTPLGDFDNMLPSGGYTVTTLPVTFNWDAVAGASKYDLYVWDAENQMPSDPIVSNLSYGYYNVSSLPNNRSYKWLVVAKNPCYETASSIQDFTLEVEPSLGVNTTNINFGEVSMNGSVTRNLRVTGVVLEDTLSIQIAGADAAMFSYVKASGWDNYKGGILRITFHPTAPQYTYNAEITVSCGPLSKTTALTGAVSDIYTFTTYVPEDVYPMNTPVPVYGMLVDWEGHPVPDADVEIGVFVMGTKRTLLAVTDAAGEFSALFEPFPMESGYYTVNSGRPGNNSTAVHDVFNIPGMTVATTNNILCSVTQDEPKTDTIIIRNKSNVPLTNIQVTTISAPAGCTVTALPFNLGGLEEGYLIYTVTGTVPTVGSYYEQLKLQATSDEGAETVIPIWYYCEETKGLLETIPGSLVTTVSTSKSKVIDVKLVNNGDDETGIIEIALPELFWVTIPGGNVLPSLAPHDTVYFSVRLAPDDEAVLYGPMDISLDIFCERGDYITFEMEITPVTDPVGSVVVDVTDDFTWNQNRSSDGPHVANAEVVVKGYHSLDLLGHGFTNDQGLFQLDGLDDGFYRLLISAGEHHEEYNGIIRIQEGVVHQQDVYLQYLPVVYSWDVTPSGVGNEYNYDLVVDYTANVPVPVITIEHSGVHDLNYGESANFNIVITNHGLIDAFDTHISFSPSSEYVFAPLYDIIDTIAAQDTIVIPGVYYRTLNQSAYADTDCDVHISTISLYHTSGSATGSSLIQNRSLPFELGNYSVCQPSANSLCNGIPKNNNSPDAPFSSHYVDDGDDGSSILVEELFRNPCVESMFDAVDDCLADNLPGGALMSSLSGATATIASDGPAGVEQLLLGQLGSFIEEAQSIVGGGLWGIRDCLWHVYDGLDGCATRAGLDFLQSTIDGLRQSSFYYYNEFTFVKSVFAADVWNTEENTVAFINDFKPLINPSTGMVSDSDAVNLAMSFVGTSVGYDDIISFVARWNRSVEYWSNNYFVISDLPSGYNADFIQIDNALINSMVNVENYYASQGYMGMRELYLDAVDNGRMYKAQGSKLHTSIKMQLSHRSAMACEPFTETFTIHNGHETEEMSEIGLDFTVTDENGNDCTHLFQITTESLQNIAGIDGTGAVEHDLDGIVKVKFVPSRQAAQNGAKVYYCGGTLLFIDPYTSGPIFHNLYPAPITITSSPDLYVDYFVPRYIIGNDTLTDDKTERSVPAELGILINNRGGKMAENVTLETARPLIIDYWNGAEVDFALKKTLINGTSRSLGLMEIPFGNIESSEIMVGEWEFTSKYLGIFEDYDAHLIHNSSFGNSDLSLVSSVVLHDLVHPVYVYGTLDDGINDFMVNGDYDASHYPDTIYYSHGGKTSVGMLETISFDHYVEPLDTIVTLTVNPSRIGWNYGFTDDPGRGNYEVVSCTRNFDNQVIPLTNLWTTPVTLKDGDDPVYENRLHFVDTLPDAAPDYTYTLVYRLKEEVLSVVAIREIPQNDIDYPLLGFVVQFNKDIRDYSFTYEDMTLTCENGPNLMDSSVEIDWDWDADYNVIYTVNITGLTNDPGVYVLTVNTEHITDWDGYEGVESKQATWTQVWSDYTQTDSLTAGWNWWSTFVEMSTAQDFDKLKNALGDNASMIKSRSNGFVSYYEGWYGSLTTLNNGEMYMINMNNDLEISITGPLAEVTSNAVSINSGWNWIGYPIHGTQEINAALVNLSATENDMLKSRNAFASYYPSLGWVGSLTTLTPGEGYMYYSENSDPISFVYATPAKMVNRPHKLKGTNHWEVSVGEYDMNATIIGVIKVDGVEQRDEMLSVGAFIDDRCVGQANAQYIEGVDRYLLFLTYYGNANDDITFRLYDESVGMEYGMSDTKLTFAPNSILGTVDKPMDIEFSVMGIDETYAKPVTLFPNPVKAKEKVRVTLDEGLTAGMEVEVFSSLGVQLYKTIARDEVLELNAPTVPGVYFIKITNREGMVSYGKMIVE